MGSPQGVVPQKRGLKAECVVSGARIDPKADTKVKFSKSLTDFFVRQAKPDTRRVCQGKVIL